MARNLRVYLAALAAGAVLTPAAAFAQDGPVAAPGATGAAAGDVQADGLDEEVDAVLEDESATKGADKPWSVSAAYQLRMYSGTFVDLANDSGVGATYGDLDNFGDRIQNVYSASGSYTLSDFTFAGELAWTHWLTAGGGTQEVNEFRFQDIGLSAAWAGYTFESMGLNTSAAAEISLPTSETSQFTDLYLGSSLAAAASKTFLDKLTLSYTLGGTKYWHEYKQLVADEGEDAAELAVVRNSRVGFTGAAGSDIAPGGGVLLGGILSEYELTHEFSASFAVWDKLSLSTSFAYGQIWGYNTETTEQRDRFTAEHAEEGRAYEDYTVGTIGLSYPIWKYAEVSLGTASIQTPKTADNKSFRFPWWSFAGRNAAAGNYSRVSLAISGTY